MTSPWLSAVECVALNFDIMVAADGAVVASPSPARGEETKGRVECIEMRYFETKTTVARDLHLGLFVSIAYYIYIYMYVFFFFTSMVFFQRCIC